MAKIKMACDFCGRPLEKYPSQITRHNFCSRKCLAAFTSKMRNPENYRSLKDYANMKAHMARMNQELNPKRMSIEVRMKLRGARLGSGRGVSYEKTFGRHTHRIVAEQTLGRRLRPGEVVHHIDGDKRNNAPENLMVFQSQKEHAKYHATQEVMPK